MPIQLTRFLRNKRIGDESSPQLYYLKRTPGQQRILCDDDIAQEIETTGAMSAEDVIHVFKAFKRCLRTILTRGDKVKIDGLGTFFVTFTCAGTEEEKDCTVKKIKKVNVRFRVDNTLRLVNDSIATTRNAANNVEFAIKGETATNNGGNGNNGGDLEDPDA